MGFEKPTAKCVPSPGPLSETQRRLEKFQAMAVYGLGPSLVGWDGDQTPKEVLTTMVSIPTMTTAHMSLDHGADVSFLFFTGLPDCHPLCFPCLVHSRGFQGTLDERSVFDCPALNRICGAQEASLSILHRFKIDDPYFCSRYCRGDLHLVGLGPSIALARRMIGNMFPSLCRVPLGMPNLVNQRASCKRTVHNKGPTVDGRTPAI